MRTRRQRQADLQAQITSLTMRLDGLNKLAIQERQNLNETLAIKIKSIEMKKAALDELLTIKIRSNEMHRAALEDKINQRSEGLRQRIQMLEHDIRALDPPPGTVTLSDGSLMFPSQYETDGYMTQEEKDEMREIMETKPYDEARYNEFMDRVNDRIDTLRASRLPRPDYDKLFK